MLGSTPIYNASKQNTRTVCVKAIFNSDVELTGDNIIDVTVKEGLCPSSGLTMGQTISATMTMHLKMPETPILLTGGYVEVYGGFLYKDVERFDPLGKFYITDVKSTDDYNKVVEISGFDAFCKTEAIYTPTIQMPNTAENILNDICSQIGVECVVVDYPSGLFNYYELTYRQWIGYFAGLVGCNARFNRYGELEFLWFYGSTAAKYRIPRTQQYLNGLERLTTNTVKVNSITSGTSDNIIVSGNGTGISFNNPFMTQAILDQIYQDYIVNDDNAEHMPCRLKWRGNPDVEIGDALMVQISSDEDGDGVEDYVRVFVMEQTITINGGMSSEIVCYGASEEQISFQTSPTSKKLQQVYTKLQEAIAAATELLNGSNGGVFEITDSDGDGVNDGWIIHTVDGKKFIKANLNGIGITTDGGATYKTAMTADGINASAINVGSLNAERIAVENYDEEDPTKLTDYIHFGEGTIALGKGDSAIILKLENDQIGFYNTNGTRLGRFTNNSFEIENLEDGQIRFQNFGFIPRTSGNISFTKLK